MEIKYRTVKREPPQSEVKLRWRLRKRRQKEIGLKAFKLEVELHSPSLIMYTMADVRTEFDSYLEASDWLFEFDPRAVLEEGTD